MGCGLSMTRQPGCHGFLSHSLILMHVEFSPSSRASVSPAVTQRCSTVPLIDCLEEFMGVCLPITCETKYRKPALSTRLGEGQPISIARRDSPEAETLNKLRCAIACNEEKTTPCETFTFNAKRQKAQRPGVPAGSGIHWCISIYGRGGGAGEERRILPRTFPDGISGLGSWWGPHKLSSCVLGSLGGGLTAG